MAIDTEPDGTQSVAVVDRWRLPLLQILVGGFALVTIAVAGWRGLRSLVSLALTLVLTMQLLIPLLLTGWNAVGLAVGFGVLVTVATLLLTQGASRATLAAILGTAIGLAITGGLAVATTMAARFTIAQGSEQVVSLQQLAGDRIDLSGLLLAAVEVVRTVVGIIGILSAVPMATAIAAWLAPTGGAPGASGSREAPAPTSG